MNLNHSPYLNWRNPRRINDKPSECTISLKGRLSTQQKLHAKVQKGELDAFTRPTPEWGSTIGLPQRIQSLVPLCSGKSTVLPCIIEDSLSIFVCGLGIGSQVKQSHDQVRAAHIGCPDQRSPSFVVCDLDIDVAAFNHGGNHIGVGNVLDGSNDNGREIVFLLNCK